ncbi:MAG: CDP-alcohol phosphatidyltransferase family protein [Desulfarculaceae bacterium]|nr:CDP-alcohol phosphatidyltransferase family protein [Desulfarculaceae bacterium]MCF8073969.1 CDP-alcohol phosphatidyltransferase family protein [Desulfarculaceae bacterium]MCF8102655.1 CDP-alcohol phosphatidyltransferase family protein [Desulfarculaceae bacterium]MCF8116104.1 CDP-alcohol phosphatidyltransferase family protein [Desulfarculaceae bacterium]
MPPEAALTSPPSRPRPSGVVRLVPQAVTPNHISFFRLACAVAMIPVAFSGVSLGWVVLLGFSAGMSDLLDGAVARQRGQVTKLGAFLDPLGDKVLALAAMVVVLHRGVIGWPMVIAILAVEAHAVLIPLLHICRQLIRRQPVLPAPKVTPSLAGKVKTFGMACGLGFMIIATWAGWTSLLALAWMFAWSALLLGAVASLDYYYNWFKGVYDPGAAAKDAASL